MGQPAMNSARGSAMEIPQPATISHVLAQTDSCLSAIENQIEELMTRLFNPPRAAEQLGGPPGVKDEYTPCTAERVAQLRNKATRINEALARILTDL